MYKLLLITDVTPIRQAFGDLAWELMGFRRPVCVSNEEEALAELKGHHYNAVSVACMRSEDSERIHRMLQDYPDRPVMEAVDQPAALEKNVVELRKLLNRINQDTSNTAFTPDEQLMVCRHEFFRTLMDRRVPNKTDILRMLRLLRSKMEPDKPCVVAELSMPEDSDFLKGRWHYGTERLELALRNIFGVEVDGLRILSCVLPGDRIVLLGCPMLFHDAPDASEDMVSLITHHVNDCIAHVDEFLGLDLSIASIRVLPALTALAMDA
ncbi:MAG: hypothetical protein IKK57_09940 [Clostridia bacterium]|nr:hypothetical protein [Clostridia bacterium]